MPSSWAAARTCRAGAWYGASGAGGLSGHDRILGQPAFVEQVRAEVEAAVAAQARYRRVTLARGVVRVGKAVAA